MTCSYKGDEQVSQGQTKTCRIIRIFIKNRAAVR